MDDNALQQHRTGGQVEPLDRSAVLKAQFRIPDPPPRQRFEVRDPFAEVTYRSHSFEDMVLKAERLGAIRFVAIAADGKRTTVTKQGRDWPRPEPILIPKGDARSAEVGKRTASAEPVAPPTSEALAAQIKADAQRAGRSAALEAALNERYVIKRAPLRIGDVMIGQTEYWHRGDTSRLAFSESTFRVSTDTNSPSVARSMVDVAEARQWQALRVTGHDDFKRLIWLEASLRDIRTVGYEPLPADHDAVRKARAAEPSRSDPAPLAKPSEPATTKQSARGGGRKAVLAALESVLLARHVPEAQRRAVMQAAADNLTQRVRNGETHRVTVYDRTAPIQRPIATPSPEAQRTRERSAPSR